MTTILLQTKLNSPQIRPSLVPRRRLVDKLNAGLETGSGTFGRRLTLISAPAGFGKTTLVGEWIHEGKWPVAWISLDEGDNDPALFWTYVITAIQNAQPGVGEGAFTMLKDPQSPPILVVLTDLLNDLTNLATVIVLVLDDYHIIEARSVHEGIAFILDHLPFNVHLVITARADPSLPLARLRVRNQLLELRDADLRFTFEETAMFLNEGMGLNLSPDDVATLEQRTEGWIAGLQLAALSIQGLSDISDSIKAFRGLDRYIIDYLVEEVLQRQPEAVQNFLLQTSILNRLSGPLCDALTGQGNSKEMLAHIERANLFLESLDYERRWYRYHQLFSNFLRQQLRQHHPESVARLHRRASEWFEVNGFQLEAVNHAFEAGDNERAGHLIEQSILHFFKSGVAQLSTVRGWLDSLPDELIRSRPRLGLAAAWSLLWTGQPDSAELLLYEVERLLAERPAGERAGADRRHLGESAAIRANIAYIRGATPDTIKYAQTALDMLPPEESFLRSVSYNMLGHAHRLDGRPLAASRSYVQALTIGRAEGIIPTGLLAAGYLVEIKAMQGQLRQAQAAYRVALDFAGEKGVPALPALGVAHVSMGDVLREWHDLGLAAEHLRQGIELCKGWQGLLATILDGYISLARVHLAGGDAQGGLEVIDEAMRLANRYSLPQSMARLRACQARIWVADGNLTAARDWARQTEGHSSGKLSFTREQEGLMLARLLILQGRTGEAKERLQPLLKAAEAARRMASVIEIRTVQALALQADENVDGAMVTLQQALALAEPEGFVCTFVDAGPAMEKLLRQAASQGLALDYIKRLLDAFKQAPSPLQPATIGVRPPSESLTERELEVVRLIAAGLTNREIAEELVVVLGTVKAHINSIYRKLDVSNRVQAVSRARELNLL